MDDPGTVLLSIHVPRVGTSMQQAVRREVASSRFLCLARLESRTMLSKPLAYPSTLDHRPPGALSAAIAVLRGGALEPESRARHGNSQAKAEAKHRCSFHPPCGGVFLPQAGPRFGLVLLQAGHHLVVVTRRPPPETTKATRWVALDWLGNAASNLACRPPSEGKDMVELEPGTDVLPGRNRRG